MDKVLLLNPPGDKLYLRDYYCSHIAKGNYYWPPIDLLVLSGILSEKYEIKVLDAIASGIPASQCLQQIRNMDIDTIIFVTGSVSWKEDFTFMKRVKNNKDVIIIASGDFLLFEGERILKEYPSLDAIILDFTTHDILTYLEAGDGGKIDNLIFRNGRRIMVGDRTKQYSDFAIPLPCHQLFLLKRYRLPHIKRHPFTSVLTSFGCPYQCSFCPFERISFKLRRINNIIEEMEYLAKIGIKEIWFRDQTFAADRSQAMGLCKKMVENRFNFTWSCETRADTIDEELLSLMKKAGCHTIMIGVESALQEILDRYCKKMTLEKIRDAFSLCKRLKLATLAHYIMGLPGEDVVSQLKLIRLAKEIDSDYASFNIATPQAGTTFREEAIKNGWVHPDIDIPDGCCSYPLVETDKLSKEELRWLYRKAIREFNLRPKFILKKIIGTRNLFELKNFIREGLFLLRNTEKE